MLVICKIIIMIYYEKCIMYNSWNICLFIENELFVLWDNFQNLWKYLVWFVITITWIVFNTTFSVLNVIKYHIDINVKCQLIFNGPLS